MEKEYLNMVKDIHTHETMNILDKMIDDLSENEEFGDISGFINIFK